MERKRLPIGTENFEKLRHENLYYVDKTGLIKELFSNFCDVTLFTRPRRFGKTLNMSMLRYFFEVGTNKSLFDGLDISKETQLCKQHMGQYPVISISLKGVEGWDFADARRGLWSTIGFEARRLSFLENSDRLSQTERQMFCDLELERGNLENSLRLLSQLLYKHYGKKVVILIDEYDVPLDKAYQRGYYDQMILLIRQMLNAALKTNDALQLAVLTGCLRISKESIFTGLNNLNVNTIVDAQYDEWFGFTDAEVQEILRYYGLSEHYKLTKEWYDGYCFGQTNVYSPWDVVKWCNYLQHEPVIRPQNFWANTSSNNMIVRFAEKADLGTREQIESLIAGESVYKELQLDLTYPEIDEEPDHIWSVLFTTGYLTQRGMNDFGEYELVIPNREIRSIFIEKIDKWFSNKIKKDTDGLNRLIDAVEDGNPDEIQDYLNDCMADSISFLDGGAIEVRENFYHGMLIGMLKTNRAWRISSNREAGNGRADIVVEPVKKRKKNFGVIIEVKYAIDERQLEQKAQDALEQITTKRYDEFFGIDVPPEIIHYGIAFYKKKCRVKMERVQGA
ncbi:MAG: ATP-binding protein [Clostridiales bacterium]|nr:ATP-binding protein [Clostridiales bacterium]